MKARRIIGAATVIVLLAICMRIFFAYAHSCFVYRPAGEKDGFAIYEGMFDCYAAQYAWDGKSTELTVPDTFNGKPITSLGGFYGRGVPCQCYINFGSFDPGDTKFILHFGKNIKEIKSLDYEQFSQIIPSADNKYFYLSDGVLQKR